MQDDGDGDRLDLLPPTFGHQGARRPYFETLIVTGISSNNWPALGTEWRKLRRPIDSFVYEHPLDLAFRLAEAYGIVLLNGDGFEAPNWSLRVSLANLPDEAYEQIGRGVRLIARGYRDMYEASNLIPAK